MEASRRWRVAGRWGALVTQGRWVDVPARGTLAAASVSHAVVAEAKTAYLAGHNTWGQLGQGRTSVWGTARIALPDRIVSAAAGLGFTCLATSDALYVSGTNVRGQMGLDQERGSLSFQRLALPAVRSVCAGLDHMLVLAGAQVWACGLHTDRQLGVPSHAPYLATLERVAIPLADGEGVTRLAAQGDTSVALTSRGRVFLWGNTEYGQHLRRDAVDRLDTPTLLPIDEAVCDVQVGGSFLLVLTADGSVYTAGYGATGHAQAPYARLTRLPLPSRAVSLSASLQYAAAVTDAGHVWTWGLDSPDGRLGLGVLADHRVHEPRRVPFSERATHVVCGGQALLVRCA